MKKALITLTLILACALACASIFWLKAGAEEGYTLEAFDYGPSKYWLIGLFAFFGVATFLIMCWKKMWEALNDVID